MLRKLKNIFHLFESLTATLIYRYPAKKLTVVGVTGTDGKTTTTTLIHHILTVAGVKASLSSTLFSPHTTTPGRGRIQKFLWQSYKNGCTHAVIEVTSIAVDQYRVWGTNFTLGVLTNIANNEHLDYHRTFANYRRAKLQFLQNCPTVILNADDISFAFLSDNLKGKEIIPYKLADWPKFKFQTQLVGEFNKANVLAATAAALALGIDLPTIRKAVASFEPPSGRLEIVIKKPYTVIVDFAHTPQAFSAVLPVARTFLRDKKKNKLIHVFGATGDRDKSKRPVMAQIAAQYDQLIILTHEDTYSEDLKAIISQVEAGLAAVDFQNYAKVYDRREAIKTALDEARPGDVVILTGVGHQKTLNLGGKEIPWSDQKAVLELVKRADD